MSQFRRDLWIRVGAGEHDRVGRHALEVFSAQQVRAGQAYEHVSAFQRFGQGALLGSVSEHRLVLVQVVTASVDNASTVNHEDVFDLRTHAHQQLHAGDGSSAGAQADDFRLAQGFASDFQGVDHARSGHDRSTVLVIVEYRDVALLDQSTFDLKALWRLDVFQVDTTEGDGDTLDGVDERLWAFRVDFDVEHIDTGETLEQNTLAFHDRLGSQRAQVTQAEDGSAVGNDCYQIALAGVLVGQLWIASDFTYRLGDARAVGQGQVASSRSRLGELDAQFPRTRLSMVFESGSFQI